MRLCHARSCNTEVTEPNIFCTRHFGMLPPHHKRILNGKPNGKEYFDTLRAATNHIARAESETSDNEMVPITGNSYPVRNELKALGGIWDAGRKCWLVPRVKRMAAQVLVGNAEQSETLFGEETES